MESTTVQKLSAEAIGTFVLVLAAAAITTSDGSVHAAGIDGPLEIDSGGGDLSCDRIRGNFRIISG